MTSILPFRLKVSGTDTFHGLHAFSTSFRFHGLLRLDGCMLTIAWGGVAQVQEVGALTIRDDRLALPDEQIIVPVSDLYRATLAGGWWRPRLALQAKELGALAMVPSEEYGTVQFWYARGDRADAHAMAAALSGAIASASPPANAPATRSVIDESVGTPPRGLTSA